MKQSLTARLAALGLIILSMCGCARTQEEASAKVDNYNKMPHSIFMIYPQGPRATQIGPGFDQVFAQFAANCKIEYASDYAKKASMPPVPPPSPADLKETLAIAEKYDWALQISPYQDHYAQATRYGAPIGTPAHTAVTYNYTLMDMADKAKVWRANIQSMFDLRSSIFRSSDENYFGKITAKAAIEALRKDGLLASCPDIVE